MSGGGRRSMYDAWQSAAEVAPRHELHECAVAAILGEPHSAAECARPTLLEIIGASWEGSVPRGPWPAIDGATAADARARAAARG